MKKEKDSAWSSAHFWHQTKRMTDMCHLIDVLVPEKQICGIIWMLI